MRLLFCNAAIAALAVSAHCVSAAPKEMRKPPVGDTLTVQTLRGGSSEVTLKAYEGRGSPLVYEIDRQPTHGSLSGLRQADANRQGFAAVTYTHGNDEESKEDEFTFRARAVSGGVSSPIKVRIRIIDNPPRLVAPSRVEFSAFAGESDVRIIGLTNAGGAILEGALRPEEPFHVDGDGRFRLGRGQSTELSIRFSPRSTAAIPAQKLVPAPADPAGIIVLAAEAKAPFAAEAGPVEVLDDGAREGKIVVTNLCSFPLMLATELRPESAAETDASLQVPAGGTGQLIVRIGADKKGGPLDLSLRIGDEFYSQDLNIPFPAVAPRLELLTAELDFRNAKEAALVVGNTGGVAGRFKLELPAGLVTRERAANFAVPPGETTEVHVRLEDTTLQDPGAVIVHLGASGKIPVHVVTAEKPPEKPAPDQGPPADTRTPTKPQEQPWVWKLNEDVKLQSSEDGSLVLGWLGSKKGWSDAQLEIVDAQRNGSPYVPGSENAGWLQPLIDWWNGRAAEAQAALDEQRDFFNKRLQVAGEEEKAEPSPAPSEPVWHEAEVSEAYENRRDVVWRIVAQQDGGERKPVSSDFIANTESGILEAAFTQEKETFAEAEPKETAARQAPEKRQEVALPEQTVKPVEWQPTRDGARITFQMPFDESVQDYRFERMQRFFGTDPDTGYARVTYEGEGMPDGTTEILERANVKRDGAKYDEVTVRFSGLDAGTEVYWRAVPVSREGDEGTPSGILHFWTLPPPRIPWTAVSLAACSAALVAVLWLRWKSRRAPN